MSDAALIVGRTEYRGWTSVAVTRSLEQLASTFDVSFSEQWSGQDTPIPILEGDSVIVALDGFTVISGYVDDSEQSYDATNHSMQVTGRSTTGDLVDCAAIYAEGRGQWRNQDIVAIASSLCAPFNVSVRTDVAGIEPIRRFAIQAGETVHECLERAARMGGLLLTTDGDGGLLITRAAANFTATPIRRGQGGNVIAGSRSGTWRERFSVYTLKSQVSGDDDVFGTAASQIKREAEDAGVSRYRPTIIVSENQETATALQRRADWERNVRAGRSQRHRYVVQGWQHAGGLWEPNLLVHVTDSALQVDHDLLVVSTVQRKDAGGSRTELELCDVRAFDVEPITARPRAPANDLLGDIQREQNRQRSR